jgi:hypothetical protein
MRAGERGLLGVPRCVNNAHLSARLDCSYSVPKKWEPKTKAKRSGEPSQDQVARFSYPRFKVVSAKSEGVSRRSRPKGGFDPRRLGFSFCWLPMLEGWQAWLIARRTRNLERILKMILFCDKFS